MSGTALSLLALLNLAVVYASLRRVASAGSPLGPLLASLAVALLLGLGYGELAEQIGEVGAALALVLTPGLILLLGVAVRAPKGISESDSQLLASSGAPAKRSPESSEAPLEQPAKSADAADPPSPAPPLADLGRDLSLPLQDLHTHLAAMRRQPLEPGAARALLEQAGRALQQAEAQVSNLQRWAELKPGEDRVSVAPFSAQDFCASAVADWNHLAAQRQLSLRWHCPPVMLETDQQRLREIVDNLLSNALRYTCYGGVLLALRRHGEQVLLQIWDTGPGIAADRIEQAFAPFQRLDTPSPWGEQGLGLGLALSRALATASGLSLQLRSRPGRGSVLELALPFREAAGAEAKRPVQMTAISGALRVLLVDSQAEDREGAATWMRGWGVSVDVCADLEQALLLLDQRPADLLLVEHRDDGELDGLAMIEILARRQQPTPAYALLATAIDDALQQRADNAGIPILSKPLRQPALRALIEATLSRFAS